MEPFFYTVDEVAGLLRVHRNTVYRWCRSGRLPATKVGKDWRIPASAVARLEDGAPASASETSGRLAGRAEVGQAFDRFVPGDHVLGLVPEVEDVFALEVTFLQAGLERDERVFKGCWWQSPAEYRERLAALGLDAEYYEHEGRLEILELGPVCARLGPEGAGRAWGEAVARAAREGYGGIWGSGSPNLDCCGTREDLLRFEFGMDRALRGKSAVALCVYSMDTCGPNRFSELLGVVPAHNRLLMACGERVVLAEPVDFWS
ncbi:MAG: hypothetical protein Kow00129_09540 [Thermoleophilia bacterium]